jgi:hypothetical protein
MEDYLSSIKDLKTKIRDGLFLAPSRSYGEQYVEPFIRKKYDLKEAENGEYDAIDKHNTKFEIKCCKVLSRNPEVSNKEPLIKRVIAENYNVMTNRLIPFEKCETAEYLANVQNVKRDHFDQLIYVLLFEDCVKVFQVETSKINLKTIPNWSDKHGRYDALGKSGQFPITKNNIKYHLDNYLIDTISYSEMAEAFKELSG